MTIVNAERSPGDAEDYMKALLSEKLADAEVPGAGVEFTPAEAESLGAFQEEALTEEDAMDSIYDAEGDGNV